MKTKIVISALLLLAGTHVTAMENLRLTFETKLKEIKDGDSNRSMLQYKLNMNENSFKMRFTNEYKPYFEKGKVPEISSDTIKLSFWDNRILVKKKTISHCFDNDAWGTLHYSSPLSKNKKVMMASITLKILQAIYKRRRKQALNGREGDHIVEYRHYSCAWEDIGIGNDRVKEWIKILNSPPD